jgi:hypothetical protein
MKTFAWVLVGLSAGLLVSPAVAETYNYFFSGKQILVKQDDFRLGYAAGAFDMLETVVSLSNKHPQQWTRAEVTHVYWCMDKQGGNTSELVKWADKIWRQNTSQVATETMFLLACIRSQ